MWDPNYTLFPFELESKDFEVLHAKFPKSPHTSIWINLNLSLVDYEGVNPLIKVLMKRIRAMLTQGVTII
jgi:hypothetical protein